MAERKPDDPRRRNVLPESITFQDTHMVDLTENETDVEVNMEAQTMAERKPDDPRRRNVLPESITFQDTHMVDLTESLMKSRQEGKFTDINIQIQDKSYPCHKVVLEANCPYFKAYFSFHEQSKDTSLIQLEEVLPSAFEMLLDFLYTSKITITLENVREILRCADFLQCSNVTTVCAQFLIQHLSVKNCLELFDLANVYSQKFLEKESWRFILDYFHALSFTPEFLDLSVEKLTKMTSCNHLCALTETHILSAVLKWLNHDKCRLEIVDPVLDNIRWGCVLRKFLDNLGTAVNEEIREKVLAAKERAECSAGSDTNPGPGADGERNLAVKENLAPTGRVRLQKTVGLVDIELSTGIAFHDYLCEEFFDKGRFPHRSWSGKTRFHCAQMVNSFYISGGYIRETGKGQAKKILPDLWKFDISTRKWEQKSPMKTARYNHSSAVVGDHLYVLGGMVSEVGEIPLSGEVYNSCTDQWSSFAQLPDVGHPTNRSLSLVCVLDKLYAFSKNLNSCEVSAHVFDPTVAEWQHRAELEKHPIDIKTCSSFKGFLVFFEPEHEDNSVEVKKESTSAKCKSYSDNDGDDDDQWESDNDESESDDDDWGSDGDDEEPKQRISRLCLYNPLSREFILPGDDFRIRSEFKLPGGVKEHFGKLMIFRYTDDPRSSSFMYEAEVVTVDPFAKSVVPRRFASYNALPFDGSELCLFSGYTCSDPDD